MPDSDADGAIAERKIMQTMPTRIANTVATYEPMRRGVVPQHGERHTTCVPLLTLQTASIALTNLSDVDVQEWVMPTTKRNLCKGMFVSQMMGKSMEPQIPDGAYCLFLGPVQGNPQGRIVLAQHEGIQDSETGGCYTVRRYESETVDPGERGSRPVRFRLTPANPAFSPMVLTEEDQGQVLVIAELVEVLGVFDQDPWQQGYEIRPGVEPFLREHPTLRPFLFATGTKLREFFGPTAKLAVELFEPWDVPNGSLKIFLMVKTPLDVKDARVLMDRFDEAWWFDNAHRGDFKLQVSMEFV